MKMCEYCARKVSVVTDGTQSLFYCFSVVAVEVPVPTPRPLQCYHCRSNKSWDHCDDVREVMSCSDEKKESCAKLGIQGELGGKTYGI